MSSNTLRQRLYGHKSNINNLNKLLQSGLTKTDYDIEAPKSKTALMHHSIENEHQFDIKNTKIIDRTFKHRSLPILEMCHIFNSPNCINQRTDTDKLNDTYAGILKYKQTILVKTANAKSDLP